MDETCAGTKNRSGIFFYLNQPETFLGYPVPVDVGLSIWHSNPLFPFPCHKLSLFLRALGVLNYLLLIILPLTHSEDGDGRHYDYCNSYPAKCEVVWERLCFRLLGNGFRYLDRLGRFGWRFRHNWRYGL